MKSALRPWADVMISQMLICRLAVHTTIKTCAPQHWVNVGAVTDASLPRHEPRLNPLEFHGRRRPDSVSQRASDTHWSNQGDGKL
ncbi:MAG: hypothetical protein R3E92_00140 [Burkholderiaceae bacterium]|nr:hypothetical protein [Rhodoferax sp.]MCW5586730.1 hypothetical protein [Chromatiales bacterium]